MEVNKREIRALSMLGQRGAFGKSIQKLAEDGHDFVVLSADLGGSSGLKRFMETCPERFINTGIAEQNMIGIAAGMAKEGMKVFATSFAPFIAMRACEQVRMDLCYMNFPVTIVGLGSGIGMAHLGNSHYGLEDISVMRSIPNMTVVSPADCLEVLKAAEAAMKWQSPMYLRLTGIADNQTVYKEDYSFEIGKGITLKSGEDLAIISCGSMVKQSLKAAELLLDDGISCGVVNMHTIKPLDKTLLKALFAQYKYIAIAEEHNKTGGLGSAIADFCMENKVPPHIIHISLPDAFSASGEYPYLLDKYGLTGEKISERIKEIIKNK